MKHFDVSPSDRMIWNRLKLEKFLIANQKQDITITVQDEGCDCQLIGLYDLLDLFEFKSVTIITANVLERHDRYKIINSKTAFKFFKTDSAIDHYQNLHYWNGNKIFGLFYNRPIWHRLGLVSHVYTHHRDKSLINFRTDPNNIDTRELFEINQLFVNHPESAQNLLNCYCNFPIKLKPHDDYTLNGTTIMHTDQLCEFYPEFLFDLVAETFTSGNVFFVTEKTVRPMLLKKPMLAMAGRDHLLYLRQMGFQTFGNYWDESYDGYEGRERYIRLLKLIDELSRYNTQQLQSMYVDMQEVLNHNYNLLRLQSYNRKITPV